MDTRPKTEDTRTAKKVYLFFRMRRDFWNSSKLNRAPRTRRTEQRESLAASEPGMMVDNGLPMLPPPPPTFRAPTRDSVLATKGKRSATVDEEDLSFMDMEVRGSTERGT